MSSWFLRRRTPSSRQAPRVSPNPCRRIGLPRKGHAAAVAARLWFVRSHAGPRAGGQVGDSGRPSSPRYRYADPGRPNVNSDIALLRFMPISRSG